MVFEGFMDFLSYLTLKNNPTPTINTLVLNSVANLNRAILFLREHKVIHAFLDNDDSGRRAVNQLEDILSNSEVIDQSTFYRNHKDLNDYLIHKSNSQNRSQLVAKSSKKGLKL